MINKIVIALLALLTLMPLNASAQVAVGAWTLHSPFTGVDEMSQTDMYVYYRSGTSLYRIDKSTLEVTPLGMDNSLNDTGVTGIYDDNDRKSVVVAYESGNMDRLYDDGKTVNMPDIRDAVILGSRRINDIAFGKENFYVATDFGFITYSQKKNEVRESLFTPKPVKLVAATGNLVCINYDNKFRFGKQSDKILTLDNIPEFPEYTRRSDPRDIRGFGGNGVAVVTIDGMLFTIIVDQQAGKASEKWIQSAKVPGGAKTFNKNIGGYGDEAYAVNTEGIYILSKTDTNPDFKEVPRSNGETVAMTYGGNLKSLWIGEAVGVTEVDYSNPSKPVTITSGIKGSDLTVPSVHAMSLGASGKIYLYNLSEHLTFGIERSLEKCRSFVNVLEGDKITDVSGVDVTVENPSSNYYTPESPHPVVMPIRLFENPANDGSYYIGSLFEGCYLVGSDGRQKGKYYTNNTPLETQYDNWACNVSQPIVDKNGNLWLYSHGHKGTSPAHVYALPQSKVGSKNVRPADWKKFTFGYTDDYRDAFGMRCEKSDYMLFFPGRYNKKIWVFNTKGTPSLGDDANFVIEDYTDQDGKSLVFNHILCAAEDKDGKIWIGTDNGVFEITNIAKAKQGTILVNHLKVPRNDGTNLADYLLSSEIVSSISVDASNRKWISTVGSGAYLVSANGDNIIEHFTKDNSILPNKVYSVCCDPRSNKVYFGIDLGLVEYNSTSAPGQESYDKVYAYPNPVRPDYTGWITITGLMENSLVKIADSAGNVFHQGRSDGGMYTWDGCNSSGERVKTGVYFVYASQNASGDSSACVTKIMVVN